ncbi:hypothetical protein ACFWBH_24965 [Streptomyces sp. NPDC059999]|uniref:hypothetical protein n=1 Tax=Streptomyces sp. NPDC059999 TaxID=3347030 RepID=UPI0036CA2942
MNKRIRIAVLAPLAASPLLLGPAVLGHAAAPTLAPAGSCVVSADAYRAESLQKVTGNGFPANTTVEVKGDNGYLDATYKVPTGGSFQLSNVPAGHYTVAGVSCSGGTDPAKKGDTDTGTGTDSAKTEYDKGFRTGFQTIKDSCNATQPKTLTTDPNWQTGYDNGTALAAKTFCGGKTDGGAKQTQYQQGHDLGYSTVQKTCKTEPPRTAAADPEWLRGYNAGAEEAAVKFCK